MQVFRCPSSDPPAWPRGTTGYLDYGMNYVLHGDALSPEAGGASNPVRLSEIQYVSETVSIAESAWTESTSDYGTSNAWYTRELHHPSRFVPARHSGGANIVFIDGHAKWHTLQINDIYEGPVKYTYPLTDVCWYADGRPKY